MGEKDRIIREISSDMELSIETVEKVVSWAYMKANTAVKEHSEVEVSGLGKFMVSKAKIRKRIRSIEGNLQHPDISEKRKEELQKELEYVKSKLRNEALRISSSPS